VAVDAIELSRRLLDDPALASELRSVDPVAIEGQDARVAFRLSATPWT